MNRFKFGVALIIWQVLFLILFGIFAEYDTPADGSYRKNSMDSDKGGADPDKNPVKDYYPMFQDVHVMMFIGFGFLMTFLKKYGYSAVGLNMLIAAFVIQWSLIISGFLHLHHGKFQINITNMLTADFCAAAVLITFGALLGKTSPLQMLVIAFIEVVVFTMNEYLGVHVFHAVDVGGSMFVHTFGAYFGLAIARVLADKGTEESDKEGSDYKSDLFAMIGTIFLWLYWPSFNSALAPGDDQHRAVINTYLALAACCCITFAISSLTSKDGKFDMVHVQNATLAGGVAVGTSADMMINPWGAILIGCLAGTLSVLGYKYLTPLMASKLKIHDTCGVHNLHGMPGVLAGIVGAIAAAFASTETYGYSLYQQFPMRAPGSNSSELATIQDHLSGVEAGENWSAGQQGGYQAVALVVTWVVAVVAGTLTGLLLKLDIWDQPKGGKRIFVDEPWWELPEDYTYEGIEMIEHGANGTNKGREADRELLNGSGEANETKDATA